MSVAHEKKLAAEAAAQLVEDGMIVGLGTGSTVAYLLPALAVRGLDLRCVATSPATEHLARDLGIKVEPFRGAMALARLDVAIDGADQVAPSGWLMKGRGAAHTREKAVAAAAERFIVIVSSDKLVERLAPPVPLELLEFGLAATLERLGTARLRDVPISPEGGAIADYTGAFEDRRNSRRSSPPRWASWSTVCSRPSWSPRSWWLAETTSRHPHHTPEGAPPGLPVTHD